MSAEQPRQPRYRRPPSWGIHDAQGIRYPGGDGSTWWDDARPVADPAPRPIYSTDCSEGPR